MKNIENIIDSKNLIPKKTLVKETIEKYDIDILLIQLKQNKKYYRSYPTKKTIEKVNFVSKVILAAMGYKFDFVDTCVVYYEEGGFRCGLDWLTRYISPNNYIGFGDVENDVLPVVSYVFDYIGINTREFYEFGHDEYYIDFF